jgi:hypothetical protein
MAWGKVPGRDPGPILSPREFLPTKYFVELFRLAAILSSRLVGGLGPSHGADRAVPPLAPAPL